MAMNSASQASIRALIAELRPGEVYSRSLKTRMQDVTTEDFRTALEKLRSGLQPHMTRAARETGNKYRVETGHWITQSGHIVLTAIVTRAED